MYKITCEVIRYDADGKRVSQGKGENPRRFKTLKYVKDILRKEYNIYAKHKVSGYAYEIPLNGDTILRCEIREDDILWRT